MGSFGRRSGSKRPAPHATRRTLRAAPRLLLRGWRVTATCVIALFLSAWTFGCCSLGPGTLQPRSAEQYADHVRALSDRAPVGSTAVIVPPVVVVGDGPPEEVRAAAHDVVEWAIARLKADYFERDPARILDVWIFRSDSSYRENASALFGSTPPSPYGYYDPCHRAILVQAGLGYGTLVHELVHAFLDADFHDSPLWFNEGFASLFEQPSESGGHIVGLVNWRLPPLQEAIANRTAASFEETAAASRSELLNDPDRRGYKAVARYLLYYLQEKGLLIRYYREFRGAVDRDPTGLATLYSVVGTPDPAAFRAEWERFVMSLALPAPRAGR